MKLLTLTFALVATLIAQPACARVINVAPNGSTNATLADIKKNPGAAAIRDVADKVYSRDLFGKD